LRKKKGLDVCPCPSHRSAVASYTTNLATLSLLRRMVRKPHRLHAAHQHRKAKQRGRN
jgi:hypothetical protein